jgi:predicted nuclease of predicted toxin-antitoxin system
LKVLLDTCVWGKARETLEREGHDVIWAGDWKEDPGDDEILRRAHADGRILVTLDKDFGELAIVYGQPHSGIVRLVNLPARQQGNFCAHVLNTYGQELQEGAIVTVDRNRVRIRAA